LPSQPKLVLIYRPRRDGRLSWPWVAGWLHTEIDVRHQELNSGTRVLSGNTLRNYVAETLLGHPRRSGSRPYEALLCSYFLPPEWLELWSSRPRSGPPWKVYLRLGPGFDTKKILRHFAHPYYRNFYSAEKCEIWTPVVCESHSFRKLATYRKSKIFAGSNDY